MPSANKFRHVERRVRPFELFHAAELHLLLGCISSVNDMELNYNVFRSLGYKLRLETREGPPPKKQEAVEEQLEADEKLEIDETREGPPPKKQEAVEEQLEADEKLEIDEVFAAEEEEKEKVTDKKKNPVEQEDIDPQYGLTDRGHPVVQETGNRDEESDDVEERV
ncbi:resistance to inhibitors of cholinesterase protein 3 isoform X1 [Nematostella vectensis]|uniref:resistance to inhibitors of cholinesterase protein 3 isoform X1 n=1 Tax=Nematostella vectensis TaxID=45351 RepID=UPI002077389A|nr:resistance to inhibitors of cholinesterase protein 3 isoform X1 [Nematostella vectensis]